jgi:hybrid cluster-associated redox disulfide protein
MLPIAANLQKIREGKRTYAVTPGLPGGFVKPDQLRRYAAVAEKYGATLKMTSAQRIMITGLKAEDVEGVWRDLGVTPAAAPANSVRSVKMCPGSAFCKRGLDDSVKLGLELDRRYHKQEMPSHVKMGVAGCPNSCAEVHTKDIGVFADEGGWTVLAGGNCGRYPRLADKVADGLSHEQVLILVDVIIDYYKANAEIERIGELIDRIGPAKFTGDVLAAFAAAQTGEKEEEKSMKITKESIIGQVIRANPATVAVFRAHGMGCLGCPSASGEKIEKAAGIHGVDLEKLLEDLNKVA